MMMHSYDMDMVGACHGYDRERDRDRDKILHIKNEVPDKT